MPYKVFFAWVLFAVSTVLGLQKSMSSTPSSYEAVNYSRSLRTLGKINDRNSFSSILKEIISNRAPGFKAVSTLYLFPVDPEECSTHRSKILIPDPVHQDL